MGCQWTYLSFKVNLCRVASLWTSYCYNSTKFNPRHCQNGPATQQIYIYSHSRQSCAMPLTQYRTRTMCQWHTYPNLNPNPNLDPLNSRSMHANWTTLWLLLERGMLFRCLFVLHHRCCSSAVTSWPHCFTHRTLLHSVQLCDRL